LIFQPPQIFAIDFIAISLIATTMPLSFIRQTLFADYISRFSTGWLIAFDWLSSFSLIAGIITTPAVIDTMPPAADSHFH